jgi:hypothetical protein
VALVPLTGGYLADGELVGDETYPIGLPSLLRTCKNYPLNLYCTAGSTIAASVAL